MDLTIIKKKYGNKTLEYIYSGILECFEAVRKDLNLQSIEDLKTYFHPCGCKDDIMDDIFTQLIYKLHHLEIPVPAEEFYIYEILMYCIHRLDMKELKEEEGINAYFYKLENYLTFSLSDTQYSFMEDINNGF